MSVLFRQFEDKLCDLLRQKGLNNILDSWNKNFSMICECFSDLKVCFLSEVSAMVQQK